jgi:hypothetical protein
MALRGNFQNKEKEKNEETILLIRPSLLRKIIYDFGSIFISRRLHGGRRL